jgi:amino acid adenylation domain-containing protein
VRNLLWRHRCIRRTPPRSAAVPAKARPCIRQFDNLSVVALPQRDLADMFEQNDLGLLNGTTMTNPSSASAVTILDDVLAAVRASPSAPAIRDAQRSLTYQQLWDKAGGVAHAIRAAGCPAGGRVVLGLSPSCEWTAALLGIWRAGAVAVLSNMEHPVEQLRQVADVADYVLAQAIEAATVWPEQLGRIVVPDELPPSSTDVGSSLGWSPSACVLHTSGSSGRPKPVVLEHDGLAHRVRRLRALYEITRSDKLAQLAAPSFDVALWETLLALVSGAQLEIPNGLSRSPGPELARWLDRRSITVMTCTPTMLAALPEVNLPVLRLIVLGGEPLHPARHGFWIRHHQVANAYGPTEATIATHVCPRVSLEDPAPIGHPVDGVEDFLLDDRQIPVPNGQIGELYLGGIGLAARYDGFPEITAAAFPALVLDGELRRVYRTGDLAYRRPDGQLVFAGRVDRQLNIGGVRLEPAEIEQAARLLPSVTEAVAFGTGEIGHQVVVLHAAVPDDDITTADIRVHLAQQLPAPAVPARIFLHRALPMIDSGKLDVRTLEAHGSTVTSSRGRTGPVALPEPVLTWWTEATGAPPASGVEFFDGGDSLAAVKLVHQVNESFGTAITISEFVADPTPEHLAHALDGIERGAS